MGSVVVAHRLPSCGARALGCAGSVIAAREFSCPVACGILFIRPGIEPESPALEGRFLTTAPPGKSLVKCLKRLWAWRAEGQLLHFFLSQCFAQTFCARHTLGSLYVCGIRSLN